MTKRRDYSVRQAFKNWRTYDGPFGKKLALTARNEWKKVVRMRPCCGHHGEPGC